MSTNDDSNPPMDIKKTGRVITNWETIGTLVVAAVALALTFGVLRANDAEMAKTIAGHEDRIRRMEDSQSEQARTLAVIANDVRWLRGNAEKKN